MRTQNPAIVFPFLISLLLLAGCIKDTVHRSYTYMLSTPVYKTKTEVRDAIKSSTPVAVQNPGKLFISGNYIFLNELDKGVHVIDNSNPASPKNIGFIAIPGNEELAVSGNTLYADLYTDLVAIDISNPLAARLVKTVENIFPERSYFTMANGVDTMLITDWLTRDTTVNDTYTLSGLKQWKRGGVIYYTLDRGGQMSSSNQFSVPNATPGVGGSTARFTLLENRLYTVSTQELSVFNVMQPQNPLLVSKKQIGFDIETIFPFAGTLFIGSANGMFIFNTANPDDPTQLSQMQHIRSCDPVIADNNTAYVTLRSGGACGGGVNELNVYDISNLTAPRLLQTYPMAQPLGLSKWGDYLLVCDATAGLVMYRVNSNYSLQWVQTVAGLQPHDVIAYNGVAIVVAADGLYQFDLSNGGALTQLSKISIKN